MYKGFVKIMYKFDIKPNHTDKKRKKIIVNYELLDSIKCEDVHQLVGKNFNFRNLSYEMSTLNRYNYLLKPRIFVSELQKIASHQATNCPALSNYINLFYTQTENLEYLNNHQFNAQKILHQAKKYKQRFMIHYGKYKKMGYYLGKLFGWFVGYPHSSIVNELKINSLMSHI
jgi:hypothetical protein